MSKFLNGQLGWVLSLGLLASSQAFAYGGYTAIVFEPISGAWGSYHGSASRNDAEDNAIALCGAACAGVDSIALENGQTSLHETWARNGWVAYAHGDGNTHWATSGIHTSQYEAEQAAYDRCGGATNNCYIVRSLASYENQEDVNGTDSSAPATPAAQ